MQRLVLDASKLNDAIKSPFEEGALDFDNIVNAIHTIQTEMGITGTTALEAGRTISGSVGSMKAAWTNLVTGFADGNADIEGLINNLVTTIVGNGTEKNLGVIGNVLPAIETALGGIVKLIEGAAPKIIGIFPKLVKRIVPSLISSATSMVNAVIKVLPNLLNTIVDAIIENAPLMIDSALAIVGELVTGILNQLPKLVKLGLDLIVSLANGITENIDTLIPTIIDVVLQIVDTITDPKTLSNLLNASLDIVLALAEGLLSEESINALVDAVWTLIENLVLFVTDLENIEKIQQAGEDILFAIINGMFNSMSKAKENLKEFIINLVNGSFGEIDWQAIGSKLLKNILKNMGPLGLAISAIEKFSSNPDGSHRNGLDYVPYDGYIAELHKGERVLTASEASSYGGTSIGNITINIDGAKYSDEQSLASAIAQEIQNMTDRRAAVYA